MTDPERNMVVYVTSDSSQWMVLDMKFGFISPPTIDLHVPQVGPLQFYNASSYGLHVPPEATESLQGRLRSTTVDYTTT